MDGYVGVGRDGKPDPHPGTNEVIAAAEKIGTQAELQIGVAIPFTNMPRTFAGPGSEGMPQAKAKDVSISTTRPTDGEDIFGCGYPLGSYGLVTTPGTIASAWNTQVLIRTAVAGFTHPVEVYEVDLRENPGNSGGPVFRSSDQAVIGVGVQSYGNLAVAVPARFVATFLEANKISWQSADVVRKPHHNPSDISYQ